MLVVAYFLSIPFSRKAQPALVRLWYRGVCELCGLTVKVTGSAPTDGTALMVSNHISYLDIPLLGAVTGGVFVSKSEVAEWPIMGWLAKLGRTVFIRRKRSDAAQQIGMLKGRLDGGDSLIVFPEGTSTNGLTVARFKSSLFAVTEAHQDLTIQPVAVVYSSYKGDRMRLAGGLQDCYAWHGDMDLLPHLIRMLGLAGATTRVIFLDPVKRSDFEDRKALALHCEHQISKAVRQYHQ